MPSGKLSIVLQNSKIQDRAMSDVPVILPSHCQRASCALIFLLLGFGLLAVGASAQPTGFLRVESQPEDAQLYIDGTYREDTPAMIELPVGTYQMEVRLNNYEAERVQVQIAENEINRQEVELQQATGFEVLEGDRRAVSQATGGLTVITEPPGLEVRIGGTRVPEATPFTVTDIGSGVHTVEISTQIRERAPGTSDYMYINVEETRQVEVQADRTALLEVDLADRLEWGTVSIASNRSEVAARIWPTSDNTHRVTPFVLEREEQRTIPAARYRIDWRLDGSRPPRHEAEDGLAPRRDTRERRPLSGREKEKIKQEVRDLQQEAREQKEYYQRMKSLLSNERQTELAEEIKGTERRIQALERQLDPDAESQPQRGANPRSKPPEPDDNTQSYTFSLPPGEEVEVFLPVEKPMQDRLSVEDHEDWIAWRRYRRQNFEKLPETRKRSRIGNMFKWGLIGGGATFLFGYTVAVASDDFPLNGTNLDAALLVGMYGAAGFAFGGLVKDPGTAPYRTNIRKNERRLEELERSYEAQMREWEREVEKRSRKIQQENREIREYNRNLPEPHVRTSDDSR